MIGAEQPMGLKFIQRSRLTAIPFNWSPAGNQFSLSRFSVKLSRKFKQRLDHCLAACEIRKSTIRKAGNGVFISEAAMKGQILFKYGGRRISFPEADRLSDMVRAFSCFVFKCIQLCYTCIDCNGFAGTGYSHKGNFHSCVLLWLEAELSVQDGVVCAEPSCRWIPQLQYKEAVQRKIFDSRGRSFCCCNQGHQKGLGGVCPLQSSLMAPTLWIVLFSEPQNRSRPDAHYLLFCSDDVFISCR